MKSKGKRRNVPMQPWMLFPTIRERYLGLMVGISLRELTAIELRKRQRLEALAKAGN